MLKKTKTAEVEVTIEEPTVPETSEQSKKKQKNIKRTLLIIVILSVLGLAAWLLFLSKEKVVAPAPQETGSTTSSDDSKKIQKLHFQADKKVYSFDPISKKSTQLTDQVPVGAEVLDVYENTDGWKLYFRTQPTEGEAGSTIGYGSSAGTFKVISESIPGMHTAVANAEHDVVAYVIPADFAAIDKTVDAATTRTFVFKGGDSGHGFEEVYRSKPYELNDTVLETDFKKFLYFPDDVSPDGKKLLFGLRSCFQCDGPPRAIAFELDIASRVTEGVYAEPERIGLFSYDTTGGIIVFETRNGFMGVLEGNLQETYSKVAKAGQAPVPLAQIDQSSWSNTAISREGKYVAVTLRGPSFATEGGTVIDGIYERTGPDPSAWKKLTVTGDPATDTVIGDLGRVVGSCVGMASYSNDNGTGTSVQTNHIGAICTEANKTTYYPIDSLTNGPSGFGYGKPF